MSIVSLMRRGLAALQSGSVAGANQEQFIAQSYRFSHFGVERKKNLATGRTVM